MYSSGNRTNLFVRAVVVGADISRGAGDGGKRKGERGIRLAFRVAILHDERGSQSGVRKSGICARCASRLDLENKTVPKLLSRTIGRIDLNYRQILPVFACVDLVVSRETSGVNFAPT
jgi:hypothetical protein